MYKGVRHFTVLVPQRGITTCVENGKVELCSRVLDIIEEGSGARDVLLSSGLWWQVTKRYGKLDSKGAFVMSDSGAFQFREPTKGSLGNMYRKRDSIYSCQKEIGDWIVAGDVMGKYELSKDRLIEYVRLTKENMEHQFTLMGDELGKKYINTLHGVSPSSMDRWYNSVKDYPSIGYAIGVRPYIEIGTVLHFLYLYQKGELKSGKILHVFGIGITSIVWILMWLREQLKLDIILSFDNSTASALRFGRIYLEEGEVAFSGIRSKKRVVKLINGEVLVDIPKRMEQSLYISILYTSLYWYNRLWNNFLDDYYAKGSEVNKVLDRAGIIDILKWFKFGGIDYIWEKVAVKFEKKKPTSIDLVKVFG